MSNQNDVLGNQKRLFLAGKGKQFLKRRKPFFLSKMTLKTLSFHSGYRWEKSRMLTFYWRKETCGDSRLFLFLPEKNPRGSSPDEKE